MKCNYVLFFAGSAVLALSACSSNEDFEDPQAQSAKKIVSKDITVNVKAADKEVTDVNSKNSRISVSKNGATVDYQFEKGDELRLYSPDVDAADGDYNNQDTTTLYYVGENPDGSATFKGKINLLENQSQNLTYYLVGGGNLANIEFNAGGVSANGLYENPTLKMTKVYEDFNKPTEELSQFMKNHYVVPLDENKSGSLKDLGHTSSFYESGKVEVTSEETIDGTVTLNPITAFIGVYITSSDLDDKLYAWGLSDDWSKYDRTEFAVNVKPLSGEGEGFAYRPIINLNGDGSYEMTYNSDQYTFDEATKYNARYFYNYGGADISTTDDAEPAIFRENAKDHKIIFTKAELREWTAKSGVMILFPVTLGRYEDFAIYSKSTNSDFDGYDANYNYALTQLKTLRNEFANNLGNDDYFTLVGGSMYNSANHILSANNIYLFSLANSKWNPL